MENNEYQLIDSGDFKKLEQVGPHRIIRPSPQAVWAIKDKAKWNDVDAVYKRYSGGDGEWIFNRKFERDVTVKLADVNFSIEPTEFGHLGVFPEQARNWDFINQTIQKAYKNRSDGKKIRVLNLFGYTGGSTLAAAKAGAEVVHVDASKTSINWARKNAIINGCGDFPIRWITDDVQKFVARELRRGSEYDVIILDPPSFGRGSKGEAWKIEEHLIGLLANLRLLSSKDVVLLMLSAHSNGYTPRAMTNLLNDAMQNIKGSFEAYEMVIKEHDSERTLPSGSCCCFYR